MFYSCLQFKLFLLHKHNSSMSMFLQKEALDFRQVLDSEQQES